MHASPVQSQSWKGTMHGIIMSCFLSDNSLCQSEVPAVVSEAEVGGVLVGIKGTLSSFF